MTSVSHSAVTFATFFATTHNVFIAGSAALGSLFPDRIEDSPWKLRHRSHSHWFVFYAAALAFIWIPDVFSVTGMQVWQTGIIHMMRKFLFWFLTGCLFHILQDAVCGPIPLLHPTKRTTVLPRLFKVGSVGEILFVIAYCAIMYLIAIRG